MPENPNQNFVTGWRSECAKSSCPGTGSEYIQCIESCAYVKDAIVDYIYYPTNDTTTTSIRTIFAGWQYGLSQSIDLGAGMITNSHKSTMDLTLNHNLSYQILIMDPSIQIINDQPRIFPITRLSLSDHYSGVMQIYLKVCFKIFYII